MEASFKPTNREFLLYVKRSLIYGGIAFVLQGLIAYWVNAGNAEALRMKAALSNGAFCFGMTLVSTTMMETLFNSSKHVKVGYFRALFGGGGIAICLAFAVHALLDTPEVVYTVVTTAVISSPYYIALPFKFIHEKKKQALSD
ncbi:MAG: hypothetical protein HRU19_13195 [Pseudobacteriovorax sp.]|nr:hypothetical protein [Pseudobacteriovorax sp.]